MQLMQAHDTKWVICTHLWWVVQISAIVKGLFSRHFCSLSCSPHPPFRGKWARCMNIFNSVEVISILLSVYRKTNRKSNRQKTALILCTNRCTHRANTCLFIATVQHTIRHLSLHVMQALSKPQPPPRFACWSILRLTRRTVVGGGWAQL